MFLSQKREIYFSKRESRGGLMKNKIGEVDGSIDLLAEVPLGTIVIDNDEYENVFVFVNFAGTDGYIHGDYLMYYVGDSYAEPCGGDLYYEEGELR